MSHRNNICLLAISTLLIGCATLSINDTNRLKRGFELDQAMDLLSPGPKARYSIVLPSSPDSAYTILVYKMDYGGRTGDYYLAFKADKLMYWGFPYEFNRYPDPIYNELGAEVVKRTVD